MHIPSMFSSDKDKDKQERPPSDGQLEAPASISSSELQDTLVYVYTPANTERNLFKMPWYYALQTVIQFTGQRHDIVYHNVISRTASVYWPNLSAHKNLLQTIYIASSIQ